jgi:hypothetical protein
MVSIHIKTHVGPDGTVNLTVPTQFRETDLDVLVVLRPAAVPHQSGSEQGRDWPEGFFEETFGSFRDDPLVRPPQRKADRREIVR